MPLLRRFGAGCRLPILVAVAVLVHAVAVDVAVGVGVGVGVGVYFCGGPRTTMEQPTTSSSPHSATQPA